MSHRRLRILRVLSSAVLLAANLFTLPAAAAQAGVTRTDLQRHDLSAPGREAVQVRVDLAPGVAFRRHTHPGEEIIYVLAGAIEYDVEGKPPVTLRAGDVLFIPAGAVHAAKNVGGETASELATYIVAKDRPLLTPAK
ncbi:MULTISPECIES: cupin domain-containing protein [Bradyrhizobium]|uniref:cupin domain-containing protein n=1 Tax=Bradyrhizobium TaxID=374 RepID=UPI00155E9952|nr:MULTISPECIES: cupin domain-containing protein [Bradyrhizobium]MDD1521238.1 cupin domain-containing protein [Bradyrhizobium sp. WBAH30]MDD1544806.1 cupin domain-containing protein [Bradyrhizobium sp. WBAH41]MDD1556818.1 cupin domain-containing protein [Bradyrhizobium sp. WBAH23]MDD1564620.1 cupin domain-containing protein [Bradyrhizobium sp. WBAH33]MDD1589828.1 cupin domain-containing protein [Bradyrhizobium sp. WBAH42]